MEVYDKVYIKEEEERCNVLTRCKVEAVQLKTVISSLFFMSKFNLGIGLPPLKVITYWNLF